MGPGFLPCFSLPCNAPEDRFFGILFGAELRRVSGFYPKADVFAEGKRRRVRWPRTFDMAPVPSGSDHPRLRPDRLLGSGSRGSRGVTVGPGPSWVVPGKAEALGKDSFCQRVALFLKQEGGWWKSLHLCVVPG